MTNRITPLLVLALLLIGGAITGGIAATRSGPLDTPTHRTPEPTPRRKPPPPERESAPVGSPAGAATQYALAARNWTPKTYRTAWAKQIALAAGRYQRQLRATEPSRVALRFMRQDRASSRARVTQTQVQGSVRDGRARVFVTLKELTTAGGIEIAGQTLNQVRLVRREGSWRVIGWTVLPGGARPPGL